MENRNGNKNVGKCVANKNIYLVKGEIDGKEIVFTKGKIGVYFQLSIPLSNASELNDFLSKFRKKLKIYQTNSGAEGYIERLKKTIRGLDIPLEVVCITPEMRFPKFEGCPNCNSMKIIETYSVEYSREVFFDKKHGLAIYGDSEQGSHGSILRYECMSCGADLTDYTTEEYEFVHEESN